MQNNFSKHRIILLLVVFGMGLAGCRQLPSKETDQGLSSLSDPLTSLTGQTSSVSDVGILNSDCFDSKKSSILYSPENKIWGDKFPNLFADIVADKNFDMLYSAEKSCSATNGERLIEFVYTTKNNIAVHSVLALFDKQGKLKLFADIGCEAFDDTGGAELINESENQLLIKCSTSGREGYSFEYLAIKLSDFSVQSIRKSTCTWETDPFQNEDVPKKFFELSKCS